MPGSRLISTAIATCLAVTGAEAGQNDNAGAGAARQVDAGGMDPTPSPPDDVPADMIVTLADDDGPGRVLAANGGDDDLFGTGADLSGPDRGLVDVHVLDGREHHLDPADEGDIYLAQTVYGGVGNDGVMAPGGGGSRLAPRIDRPGARVTLPDKAGGTPTPRVTRPGAGVTLPPSAGTGPRRKGPATGRNGRKN